MEIKSVELVQTMRGYPIGITIDTVLNKQLQFNCTNAPDVHELVSSFMEGLKARSRYAVAVRDVTEPSFLKVEKDFGRWFSTKRAAPLKNCKKRVDRILALKSLESFRSLTALSPTLVLSAYRNYLLKVSRSVEISG